MHRSRKPEWVNAHRGFESHPLRHLFSRACENLDFSLVSHFLFERSPRSFVRQYASAVTSRRRRNSSRRNASAMTVFIERRLRQIRPIERTNLGEQKCIGRTNEPSFPGVRIRYHQRLREACRMRPSVYKELEAGEGPRRCYL